MKKVNFLLSIIVVVTVATFILTLAQNMVLRSEEVYLFYFNDSRAVNKIYTSKTSNEVAEELASFMNTWKPEEFQIYEDTGYDLQGIFTEEEGYNMLSIKAILDISLVVCIASLIISVAIYIYFIRQDKKLALKRRFRLSLVLTFLLTIGQMYLTFTEKGMELVKEHIFFYELGETSILLKLLGDEYIHMANVFFILFIFAISVAMWYVNYRLTKPVRIFY